MIFSSGINLQLPANPDDAVKPEIAIAILPLHYALHSLHKGVSQATGQWQPQPGEFASVSAGMSLLAGNHRRCYKVASVAIVAGQLVYITATGQMALASAAAAGTLAQGWATRDVGIGAVGEFVLFEGLLAVTGAVAGTRYYLSDIAGSIAAAPGTIPQLVGIGLEANLVYMKIPLQ